MVAWGAAERPDHGEAEVTGAEEERGLRRWGFRGALRLGSGHGVKGGSTGAIKGRGGGLGVRARGEETAGDLGEALRAGEERGRGREGADSRGPAVRERKEGAGVRGAEWAGRGPCGEKERRWEMGLGRVVGRGKKGKERAREKKREGLGWPGSFLFLFLFYI
jgi:hypothetical protein